MFIPSSDSAATPGRWFGDPLVKISDDLQAACGLVPTFTRTHFGANPRSDVIVREKWDLLRDRMPVAVVSKNYLLVQHRELLEAALGAFESCGIPSSRLETSVWLSGSGTRLAARVRLPDEHSLDPGDGHPIDLTFECFNSVDRSVPLFALLGWFRLVCSNGMVVGTTAVRLRARHAPPLDMSQVPRVLREGIEAAQQERNSIVGSLNVTVATGSLARWIDGPLGDAWGPVAAGRVYHIVRTGQDGTPRGPAARVRPHERRFESTGPVPGARANSRTLFDITQAMSWLASHRRNFQERLTWRAQIPALVDRLRKAA